MCKGGKRKNPLILRVHRIILQMWFYFAGWHIHQASNFFWAILRMFHRAFSRALSPGTMVGFECECRIRTRQGRQVSFAPQPDKAIRISWSMLSKFFCNHSILWFLGQLLVSFGRVMSWVLSFLGCHIIIRFWVQRRREGKFCFLSIAWQGLAGLCHWIFSSSAMAFLVVVLGHIILFVR